MKRLLIVLLLLLLTVPSVIDADMFANVPIQGNTSRENRFEDCSSESSLPTSLKICAIGDSVIDWATEGDSCQIGRLSAFASYNQTDNRSIGGTRFHYGTSCPAILRPIGWCGDPLDSANSQFGQCTCEGTGDCDWLIMDGGYWDVDLVCGCGTEEACDPCPSGACLDAVDNLAHHSGGEGGWVYDFIADARSVCSSMKIIIVGYYGGESGTGWAKVNGCLWELNDRYQYIAESSSHKDYVWFIDNEDPPHHNMGHTDFIYSDGAHPLKKYRLEITERIAAIIKAN